MKKILALVGLIILMTNSYCCPTFKFHITFSGTQTFIIENMSNPLDNILVTGLNSVDAWSFNTHLAQPCGLTFGADICYKIHCAVGTTSAEAIAIKFTGGDPVNLTINYDISAETYTVTTPGNTSTYSINWGNVSDNPPSCLVCNSDIVILYNYLYYDNTGFYTPPSIAPTSFTTPLTQSSTFIAIGDCVIPTGADVRLDAEPINGFVQIFENFEVQPGAIFIAEALDGCGALIPMRLAKLDTSMININEKAKEIISKAGVFLDRKTGAVILNHELEIEEIKLFDKNGKILLGTTVNNSKKIELNISSIPSGIYFLKGYLKGQILFTKRIAKY
jgi:Secretion system C-terminal sorting domain